MITAPRITLVNDKVALNQLYRGALAERLAASGTRIDHLGIFGGARGGLRLGAVLSLAGHLFRPVISSNLRTNMIVLAMPWVPGMVILNGMGRHRGSRRLRGLLRAFVRINTRKRIAVQSYADYRYLRRYSGIDTRLAWVPGSGGRALPHGPHTVALAIQRDDKLALVAPSLNRIFTTLTSKKDPKSSEKGQIAIVGCTDQTAARALFPDTSIIMPGRVPPDDIFALGGTFLQPSGYGEGFPHTLADALCSNLKVLIARREYLRYGLHRLGITRTDFGPGWSRLNIPASARARVHVDAITTLYIDIFYSRGEQGMLSLTSETNA